MKEWEQIVQSVCLCEKPPTAALVPDVLEGGGDVDLLGALGHAVQDHVDEDIGPGSAHSIA